MTRVKILNGPTPLEPLRALENRLRSEAGLPTAPKNQEPRLWVKRDDAEGVAGMGGNKARKLEFIVARVLESGAREVATPGMWGSNHALAVALAAREFGFRAHLLLGPQPVTDDVRLKLLAFQALGARITACDTVPGLGLAILRARASKVFYVPAGGSSLDGVRGYFEAYQELMAQIGGGPLPARIYVPYGSGGTAAGLIAGARASGHAEKLAVHAVCVTHPWVASARRLARLAASHDSLRLRPEFRGPGYGAPTPEAEEALTLAHDTEGLKLDATYSAKALACLIADARAALKRDGDLPKSLFWLTYRRHGLEALSAGHPWRELPRKLWPLYLQARAPVED